MKKLSTKYKAIKHLTTFTESRVKFNEADPLGIVWHGNYVSYFEDGREDFGRKHGISYMEIYDFDYSTPIIEFRCFNKFPLRYGDTFTVETSLIYTTSAKMIFHYNIYNQDKVLVCSGQTTQVFVHKEKGLALYPPDFYQSWKKKVNFEMR